MQTENIQLPNLSVKNELTIKFSNSLLKFFSPLYWRSMYSIEYIKVKYAAYKYKKKYTYPELKNIHNNLNKTVENLKKCINCNTWLTKKLINLYSELSQMLDNKKKQEKIFLSEFTSSLKEIKELTGDINIQKDMNKKVNQLEYELQNY